MSFPLAPTSGQVFITPGGKKFVWSAVDGWSQQTNNAAKIIAGQSFPLSTTGNDGDYYISAVPYALYGPKAAGAWPLPGTLVVVYADPVFLFPTNPVDGLYISFPVLTSVATSGGTAPYLYSITAGSLPNGLMFTPATGAISGTPIGPAGAYAFTVSVVDGVGSVGSASYSGTVSVISTLALPLSTSLPAITQATPYNASIAATGGVPGYTYSVVTGTLPAGLSLSTTTGVISGQTPNTGAYSFTIQAVDARSIPVTMLYTGSILPLNNLVITPSTMNIQQGLILAVTLVSTGVAPFSWVVSSGALPAGVTLNAITGAVAGTPTGIGPYSFTIQSTDSTGNGASLAYTGTAHSFATLTIYPLAFPVANASVVNQTFSANGGTAPYTWAITSGTLPNGLSLNTTTGVISGTDSPSGGWAFTLRVKDNLGFSTIQPYSGNDAVIPGSQTWIGSPGYTGGGYAPVDTITNFTIPPYNWLTIEAWGSGGGGASGGWQGGVVGDASVCCGNYAAGGSGGAGAQSGGAQGAGGAPSGGNAVNIYGSPGNGHGGAGANGGAGGAMGGQGAAGAFPGGGGGGGGAGGGGGGAYVKSTYIPGALAVGQSVAVDAGGGGNGGYAGSTWQNGGPGAAGKVTITWG